METPEFLKQFDLSTQAGFEAAWAACIGHTVEGFRNLAFVLKKAIGFGHDVKRIDKHFRFMLERIADGVALPEIMVSGLNMEALQKQISLMPLDRQRYFCGDIESRVSLVECDAEMNFSTRQFPVRGLTAKQVKQVFDNGVERSFDEQVRYIHQLHQEAVRNELAKDAAKNAEPIQLDMQRRVLRVAGLEFTVKQLSDYCRQLSGK